MTDGFDRNQLKLELTRDEGRKNYPYRDSLGLWTAGVGHNLAAHGIDHHNVNVPIPDAVIDAWLDGDIDEAETILDQHVAWWRKLDNARQRALLNLCFMGWGDGRHGLSSFHNMLANLASAATTDYADYSAAVADYAAAATALDHSLYARQVGARAKRIEVLFRDGDPAVPPPADGAAT